MNLAELACTGRSVHHERSDGEKSSTKDDEAQSAPASSEEVTLYLRNRCEQYHEYVHVLECTSRAAQPAKRSRDMDFAVLL